MSLFKVIVVIERLNQDIIIRSADGVNMVAIQKVIDYINVLEIVSQNQGTEEQAEKLAKEVNLNWWKENKNRFIP